MAARIPDFKGEKVPRASTGNPELDRRITDGFPPGSLVLVDDGNDTGKSMLAQQIMYAAMKQECSVDLFTTKNTTRNYVRQMGSMSSDISEYSLLSYIRASPHDVVRFKWNKEEMVNI